MIEIALALFASAMCIVGKRMYWSWVNPISVLFSGWGVALFIYSLRVVDYPDLRPTTGWAIVSFFVGYLWSCVATKLAPSNAPSTKGLQQDSSMAPSEFSLPVGLRLVWYGSLGIGLAAVALALFLTARSVGIEPALTEGALRAEREEGVGQTIPSLVVYGVYLLIPASFLSGCVGRIRGNVGVAAWAGFAGAMAYSALTSGRTFLLLCLLNWLLAFFTPSRWRKRTIYSPATTLKLAAIGAATVVVFVVIYVTRGSFLAYLASASGSGVPDTSVVLKPWLEILYVYLAGSIASLDFYILSHRDPYTWFRGLFHPAMVVAGKFGVTEPVLRQGFEMEAAAIPWGTNVYSLLRTLYMDLGILGCLLGGVLLGYAVDTTYRMTRRNGCTWGMLLYGYFSVTAFSSWYEYMTYSTSYVVPLALCILVAVGAQLKFR